MGFDSLSWWLILVEAVGIEPASLCFKLFMKYYQRQWKTTLTVGCRYFSKILSIVFHGLKLSTDGADMVPVNKHT